LLTEALADFPASALVYTLPRPPPSDNMSGAPCREPGVSPQLKTFCEINQGEIIQPLGNSGAALQVLLGCTAVAGLAPLDVSR